MLTVSKAYKTASLDSLLLLCRVFPADLLIKFRARIYSMREEVIPKGLARRAAWDEELANGSIGGIRVIRAG